MFQAARLVGETLREVIKDQMRQWTARRPTARFRPR
jgi:predicted proteasome-type protease